MKDQLQKFLTVAKGIIYDKKRADIYLPLLDTQAGSVSIVANVMGAIEQRVEIPPEIKPILATNIYLLMVDVAMQATGEKPDKEVMKQTLQAIITTVDGPKQKAPQGLLAQGAM